MTRYLQSKRNHNNNRYKTKNQLHKTIHNSTRTNSVINLSNTPLNKPTTDALYKGLQYIPTPRPTPYSTVYNSFLRYRRQMYLRYHFRHTNNNKHPFKLPSKFTPPPPDNANLTEYISQVYHDIKTKHTNAKAKQNLSPGEKQSINALKRDNDIIIKPSDKGGCIVIWPKVDYMAEAYRQLNNKKHYTRINSDPTTQLQNTIRTLVNQMYTEKIIDYTTYQFLLPHATVRTPILYLLPKIHKPDIPGRPIIAGCGGPTVSLSQYADHILKPLLTKIPSYITDTTAFLQRIFSLNGYFPTNSLLVTIDVKSLYTNIPNDEGINACIEMLECDPNDALTTKTITDILSTVLNNNYFMFNNEHFLQIHGTAMGSAMAPSYANIFMAVLEKQMLQNAPNGLSPFEWIRFIDDIFAIWTHGIDALQEFCNYINNFHNTIKFEITYSDKTVNFLDTTIYINNDNKLESDIYIKPTDRTLLLHNDSFHPQSCKNGIISSQALRYRRLITNDATLQRRLNNLAITLINRGYKRDTIQNSFQRAQSYTQQQLLYKEREHRETNSPIFSVPYNQNTTQIGHILRKHWHIIEKDCELSILWPEAPILAYQRNKNLKDSLVHAKLTNTTQ